MQRSITRTLPSVVYHALVVLSGGGIAHTGLWGVTGWTGPTTVGLLLAGLLTLVYPHVGNHRWHLLWLWGQPDRSVTPWFGLLLLLSICLSYVGT